VRDLCLGAVPPVGISDVLLNRVPVVLAQEIYALAALVAAVIDVVAEIEGWFVDVVPWVAAGACFVIRLLALRYGWGLPVPGGGAQGPRKRRA